GGSSMFHTVQALGGGRGWRSNRAGGGGSVLRASATLINFTIDNNGLIETFACNEGSGDTITGSNGTVWTIQTTGDINHINNNMWNTAVSQPPGFAEVTSLSVGGRSTQLLLDNLLDNPANHTPGTVTYEIARIYDNYSGSSNHNPAGYDTFFIGTMTNDIGNIGSFLTPSEYATALTSVLQIFNGTYSGPNAASLPMSNVRAVVGTVGTFDTAVKQSQKNYDTTIGAMLSGDPLNPTPESAWDFNTDETGLIAVSPLYVVQAISVTTNLGNSFANVFQAFIDGQTSPTYHDWIGLDGTHYTGDGYNNYGIAAAVPINGLVPEASKVCVLMDSLGDGVAETLQSALNAS
ncbi:MAG: hypothetical protein R3279_05400, partial [Putridiphycobacter sp.]|nr:hypothetical protein [Putridiphycobacter sp.]